jgi:MATE family multidrug resistance protein
MVAKKNWGYLFNNDPEVVNIVASIMPYIALFQVGRISYQSGIS